MSATGLVAEPFLEGLQRNVRVIRLSSGQTLPGHSHRASNVMIYAVEGEGTLDIEGERVTGIEPA
jgi:quercetin dioxygenase-like cupin family protein